MYITPSAPRGSRRRQRGGQQRGDGNDPGYDGEPTEMYICYLCVDRDVMLIRRCPIYWDECHLVCYAPHSTAAAAAVFGC
ncbi:hypothetical protein GUJ93_ZPchr1151g22265 [Zizania palustris]|uniref:Uncharacterized protein n=1 Tax=Zizania palustris TaxID=103762 RepID=A0A8J5QUI7_ZIZPA|nr:hypothetical protein GUJ93_ZPchr1151g22265 [Zizania palustris]